MSSLSKLIKDKEFQSYTKLFFKGVIKVFLIIMVYIALLKLFNVSDKLVSDRDSKQYEIAETATKLIYEYRTLDDVNENAELLKKITSSEIFPTMDNRIPSVLTTRFNKYVPTKPYISEVFSPRLDSSVIYVIVEFEPQTLLENRLLVFTFDEQLIVGYKEYYLGSEVYPLDASNRTTESFIKNLD